MSHLHDPSGGYQLTGGPPRADDVPRSPAGPGLAAGALACSVVGLLLCLAVTVAGVVMGHIAYRKAKRGEATGRGVALAALIVGYAGFGLNTAVLTFFAGNLDGFLRLIG